MNKLKFITPLLMGIIICSSLVRAKAAVDISIGISTWYHDWVPPWKDGKMFGAPFFYTQVAAGNPVTILDIGSLPFELNDFNFKRERNFMGGPVVSLRIGKVSISSVAMFGSYVAESSGPVKSLKWTTARVNMVAPLGIMGLLRSSYKREIFKYDVDSTLNCKVNRFVKLFVGFKYQGYEYKESQSYLSFLFSGLIGKSSSNFVNMGPGAGIGFTFPVHKSLYLLYNISTSFLLGESVIKVDPIISLQTGNTTLVFFNRFTDEKIYSIAGNTSLSIAYYISKANLTLSIGARYQVIYYFFQKENSAQFLDYDKKFEHFYGASIAMIYSFRIGAKKK